MIYFDNAATTFPKPRRVRQAVQNAMECYGANPGRSSHTLALRTAMRVYACREAVAALFGAQPEHVVFTSNCSHALNIAIKGLLRPGDHAVVSELDHNSVLRPVYALTAAGVITYSTAAVDEEDDDATLRSFAAAIRPETRLVACTHGSNVNGLRLPVERIAALAKERGVFFLVDAAQTAGVLPIDMGCGIDFLCAAGHKSLYGPPGTGILITPHGNKLTTLMEGGSGASSADPFMPEETPERLECGTLNTAGILGLNAGIDFVNEKGMERLYRHEMKLGAEIFGRLARAPRVKLYTRTFQAGRRLPVIPFNIDGLSSEETVSRLSDRGFALRGGLHCAPLAHQRMGTLETGAARISIGACNTEKQAVMLCEAIRTIGE